MKKDTVIIITIVLLGILLYGLTLRGALGNPNPNEYFKNHLDTPTSTFESSHERGPYAHAVNMAENGTYAYSHPWGDVSDTGTFNGKFYSLFAPGVAYLILPFYLAGHSIGLGQIFAFSAASLISLVSLVFLYFIGRRVFKLSNWAALFSVLVFAFGSTSWSYAVTIYQHSFSVCFIVTGFYAVWRYAQNNSKYNWLYAAYVWLAYALAISVDYPNAMLMLPVMAYLTVSTFSINKINQGIAITIRWSAIATFIVFAFVTSLQFWHNATYYGGWSHLAGELHDVNSATSTPTIAKTVSTSTPAIATTTVPLKNKSAVGFFHEQSIPNSFFVLLFSDERGLLFFSPIFLFSILGIMYVLRRKEEDRSVYIVPIALVAVNVFLYSAWGDPWGGWAYGPRYLIPSMPWLALFVGIALTNGRYLISKKIIALILFLFSSAVALLGALTSNAIPTKSEAALLPIKMYNFMYDIPFLQNNSGSSFIYKTFVSEHFTLMEYFVVIYAVVALIAIILLFLLSHTCNHE